MIKQILKIAILFFVFGASVYGSIAFSRYVAENIFFDKFYYYKSVDHGYLLPGGSGLSDSSYGDRSKNLIDLNNKIKEEERDLRSKVLGKYDDDVFTIALIGDSYLWGQGVRNENIVSSILEKKINSKTKKAKILSFGYPGDSILDFLIRYENVNRFYDIDLFIFLLVENDLLLIKKNIFLYEKTNAWKKCFLNVNNFDPIYDIIYTNFLEDNHSEDQIAKNFISSWNSDSNLCLLEKSLEELPTNSAYYLIGQYYHDYDKNNAWSIYQKHLRLSNKKVIKFNESKEMKEFKRYWKDPEKFFLVSKIEAHPSKTSHEIYAELIYRRVKKEMDL